MLDDFSMRVPAGPVASKILESLLRVRLHDSFGIAPGGIDR